MAKNYSQKTNSLDIGLLLKKTYNSHRKRKIHIGFVNVNYVGKSVLLEERHQFLESRLSVMNVIDIKY